MPKLEKWYFDQSIICEENKKIICRNIKDNQNNKIGKEVRIHVRENESIYYYLRYKLNSIYLLEKKGYKTTMLYVSLNNNIIKRETEIKDETKKYVSKKEYNILNKEDLLEYENSNPLWDISNNLNEKHKIRKRN